MSVCLRNLRLALGEFVLTVDLELEAHVTAIFGASGAGKTSLLDVIAGLRKPERAEIRLNGETLTDTTRGIFVPPHRRRIGYVPQDLALFPHMSVRQNLHYGHAPEEGAAKAPGLIQVTDMLDIGGLLARRISQISGGERQRVALGRALLADPKLLLLDEPLASLDAGLKERILPYLRRIRDSLEIPIVYVSHDRREVVTLCDEVVVLERGQVTRRALAAELLP